MILPISQLPQGQISQITPSTGITFTDSSHLVLAPATTTTYTLISFGACNSSDTELVTIQVTPPPQANIQFPADTFNTNQTITFTNSSTGADSIYGIIDGVIVTPLPPSLTFSTAGAHCITLVNITNAGCVDSVTHCIVIKDDSCAAQLTMSLSPNPICSGDTSILTLSGGAQYQIFPSASTTWIDTNHVLLFPTATTTYGLISANLCSGFDTISIVLNVQPIPVANFSATPIQLVTGQSVTLTDYSTNFSTEIWAMNGTVITPVNNSVLMNNTGQFCFQLLASNSLGCSDSVAHCVTVGVPCNPTTFIYLTDSLICPGDSSMLVIVNGTLSQLNPSINTIVIDSQHVNLQPTSTTNYTVVVKDDCNQNQTLYAQLNVLGAPSAEFSLIPPGNYISEGPVSIVDHSANYDTAFWLLNDLPYTVPSNGVLVSH